jgi:hypothetical protein
MTNPPAVQEVAAGPASPFTMEGRTMITLAVTGDNVKRLQDFLAGIDRIPVEFIDLPEAMESYKTGETGDALVLNFGAFDGLHRMIGFMTVLFSGVAESLYRREGKARLVFDRFPSRDSAQEFAAEIVARFGKKAWIFDNLDEAQQANPVSFDRTPPIVHTERHHGPKADENNAVEDAIKARVKRFGGEYAGP